MCPRIAVVGAGITGLLTALACARKGAEVDIYDLNDIPNKQSNSWAYARLWRIVHEGAPSIEDLAERSEAFWNEMMLKTSEKLVRPVNVIRVNNEPDLQSMKKTYDIRQRDSYIATQESSGLGSFFRIKDRSHKILTGKDGLLLNADLICQRLTAEARAIPKINLIPNSDVFSNGILSLPKGNMLLRKYSVVIFSTSAPVISGPKVVKKRYQYHIDVELNEKDEFRDAILNLGDENNTWCVPSMDGRKLKLSASKFSFDTFPDEVKKRRCLEYLLDMIKVKPAGRKEHISTYYERGNVENSDGKPWRVDMESGCVMMEACNSQHFKTAPSTAEDISEHVFSITTL